MTASLSILQIGSFELTQANSAFGPGQWQHCADLAAAQAVLAETTPDALLVHCADAQALEELLAWPALSQASLDSGVVVIAPAPTPGMASRLLQAGVQDIVARSQADPDLLMRTLWMAAQRKQAEQHLRRAWSIDLATGLPNQAQLVDLLGQLCALREREPAHMALLVLRIEGLSSAQSHMGAEMARALRRKIAVRLRAGVRSSDLVCALGNDAYAVLLPRTESDNDARRVATKLSQLVTQPYTAGGQAAVVSVATGLSHYPTDGRTAEDLLRRALSSAALQRGAGRTSLGRQVERAGAPAANDD
ncbi:GGDEF domain-containing protein [Sphaerotilus hippei]|nr:GGDEF domain-containing protein [Sphaerotilus hippei]